MFKLINHENKNVFIYEYFFTFKEFLMEIQIENSLTSKHLIELLLSINYEAIFFESESYNWSSLNSDNRKYKFAILNAPSLAKSAEESSSLSFQEHLHKCNLEESYATSFENLGHDAKLIIPCDTGKNYGHLLSFVRNANKMEIQGFLKYLGSQTLDWIKEQDSSLVWFNTSGTGVSYLHFRLDSRPKYYQYQPFKS